MKAQIVSFHCVLKDKLGRVLSSSFNRDVINQLEAGASMEGPGLRGLVAGIQNVREGEKRRFTVSAEEGYGPYLPDLVVYVPRSELRKGDRLVVGNEVVGKASPEDPKHVYRVVQARPDMVVLDGNHPLAGQELVFEIEVVSARDAEKDDLSPTITAPGNSYLH